MSALAATDPEPYAREMAAHGGRELKERAQRMTPERSGAVKRAWRQTPVNRTRSLLGPAYESVVENRHPRAGMVERGVEPHEIKPAEAEAITPDGQPRAAAQHPGYPGAWMTQRAAAEVEVYADRILEPEVEAFTSEVERRTEVGH